MKHMWSPWRMAYIEKHNQIEGCAFCEALAKADGPENLILHRGERAFLILNRFPYTGGHLMAVACAHQPSLEDLDATTRAEMMELATQAMAVLRTVYHPDGFNLGVNIGEAAGAGIREHVHLHVVPRWGGDTNFMSTLAGTRVLPESLEETYRRFTQAWAQAHHKV